MNKNILFIIPDERKVYQGVDVNIGAFHLPSLAFAILGAIAKKNGFNPVILDLTIYDDPQSELEAKIQELAPVYVGITSTTAMYYEAMNIARTVRRMLPSAKILIGGTHASSVPQETLANGLFDYVFIGEAEVSLDKFLKGVAPQDIAGIAFKNKEGNIQVCFNSSYLKNLDDYPFPDYSLYDLTKYRVSKLHSRRNPVVWIETSRGCPFNCQICNKVIHGQNFRPKSVRRVLSEIEFFLACGIREFHLADDGFTIDRKRAGEICDRIMEKKLKFFWSCMNGIRADGVNRRLLEKMKKAGCYRFSLGIESGNQGVLDNLGKRITLQQVENVARMAKELKIEVFGFFMLGFIDETEETMKDTINFARRLPLALAKVSIIIPFPGSPIYTKYKEMNLIYPTRDYRYFNFYVQPRQVYRHPTLSWEIIEKYQKKFYCSFYFNPTFIINRFLYSLRRGTIFLDLGLALKMKWFKKKRRRE